MGWLAQVALRAKAGKADLTRNALKEGIVGNAGVRKRECREGTPREKVIPTTDARPQRRREKNREG